MTSKWAQTLLQQRHSQPNTDRKITTTIEGDLIAIVETWKGSGSSVKDTVAYLIRTANDHLIELDKSKAHQGASTDGGS